MKKLMLLLLPLLALWSCEEKVTQMVTYTINEPVFMSADDFRASLKVSHAPHAITGIGKMAYYEGYLYMSEPGKGIHVIDNRNPAQPEVVGYIELLGNADLAIRDNKLYADSYIDLVWFDVSNPATPSLSGRLEKVFPAALPPSTPTVGIDYTMVYNGSKGDSICVGWNEVERQEPVDEYRGGWFWGWGWLREGDMLTAMNDGAKGGSTNGVNGSMSRFTIYDNKLYSVLNNQMTIFDLSPATPVKAVESFYVGWNVETIFSYKDNMFMGTPTGLIIYSVTDPLKPVFQSSITHVFGCDPVVVENDIAYVTVRSGNNCGQNNNELIIMDVSNVKAPKTIVSYAMVQPKGLGIDNNKLFLCDDGLKIFDATDPQKLIANLYKHYTGMDGYDVIPFNNTLMMISDKGIYQYDYTDVQNIKQLSLLPFAAQ